MRRGGKTPTAGTLALICKAAADGNEGARPEPRFALAFDAFPWVKPSPKRGRVEIGARVELGTIDPSAMAGQMHDCANISTSHSSMACVLPARPVGCGQAK